MEAEFCFSLLTAYNTQGKWFRFVFGLWGDFWGVNLAVLVSLSTFLCLIFPLWVPQRSMSSSWLPDAARFLPRRKGKTQKKCLQWGSRLAVL